MNEMKLPTAGAMRLRPKGRGGTDNRRPLFQQENESREIQSCSEHQEEVVKILIW